VRPAPPSATEQGTHANSVLRPDHASRRKPATISVHEIQVRFGSQVALSDVSLEIVPGEVLGLIGPNGAGKTTLIDVISGFQLQRSGSVRIDGRPLGKMSPARRARLGISRSFQSLELFEDMNILDNLRAATDSGLRNRFLMDLIWPRNSQLSEVGAAAVEELRLGDVLDKLPSEVDYARRRLVAIARTVSLNASVILLDEPAAGLGQAERAELATFIRRLASEWGIGVLIIEHDVAFMLALCDRVVALEAGRVIATGPPQVVRNDPGVIAAYLGAEAIETAELEGVE
jgi:sulfate-transporting ATPase